MPFAAVHESGYGTSRTSGDVRPKSAKWAEPDIDQVAVTNRDFMSTRPSMRGLVLTTVTAIGIGLLGLSGASAVPANGIAVSQATAADQLVQPAR
jgi:hypothetical protein